MILLHHISNGDFRMSKDVLMFQQVWDNIHNAYNRINDQPISATNLPRGNYSDACKVLSGMSLLDILTEINVELKTSKEELVVIFSREVKLDD